MHRGVVGREARAVGVLPNLGDAVRPALADDQAEEAVNFYSALFKNSKIGRIFRYNEEAAEKTGRPVGSVLTIEFQIEGQKFVALNGGPLFKFNESISFVINCETQEEVDYFWGKLTADGGEESQCGWLKDKFGLSWQVPQLC